MSSKRKSKFQTHGALDQDKPTTLDAIWGGTNELAKYGTLDEDEYKNQLSEMTRADLEAHARRVGLVPLPDSERLRKNLIREFQSYAAYLRQPAAAVKRAVPPQKVSKKVQSILNEGR
jgi:hypothetical protein